MPKIDPKRRITLSADQCRQADLQSADEVDCIVINGRITLAKASRPGSKGGKLSIQALSVYEHAEKVFHSKQAAIEWMTSPQRGLGMRIPSNLLSTSEDRQKVHNLLGKIEYGDAT
ncbi:MbcA/ParS/Xre antitoxin family protein [Thiohalobacter thiocyanaticus]|uniref:DUF2384 domain-containing protein n=1 Tax=Thiohalobacter thiocyanaticus TaxID=585455 RepID=A0A426QKF3_9GAMM|nr:MbcA/ParS/Xre antitoxin family protein [Thiohalobacter thiocyanaticus]RRQ22254.1 DUF2384 domain-containing protein [Thiohalobacter thiocyanaticus]